VSAENVEKARLIYPTERTDISDVFAREDAVALLESQLGHIFDPEFETVDPTGFVSLEQRGMEGFVAGWREWLGSWESWAVVAEDFVAAGDKVLVLLDIVARARASQVELPQRGANILTFSDGRIVRVELYVDGWAAREAFGP
jgi:ketosteroid isomerase-like protein